VYQKRSETNSGFRCLCVMAALIVAFTVFLASCSKNDNGANEATNDGTGRQSEPNGGDGAEAAGNANANILDNFPDTDYGGYNFTVYMRDMVPHKTDFAAEGIIGEPINDTVYERNKKIGEKFNINVELVYYDAPDWQATGAQKAIKAGDDIYDLLALHGGGAFLLAQNNLILDLFEHMPHMDLDAPWWAADTIKNLSAFGKLYCVAGDISHMGLSGTGGVLFNKNLFGDLNIEYPYADVTGGKWTIDRFYSIVRGGASDLNGDGEMKLKDDRFGLEIRHDWDYPISVLYCGGDRVITIGEDGVPAIAAYNERTVDIFNKFFDLLSGNSVYMHIYKTVADNYPTDTAFRDGRALFYTTYLQDVINHRDLEYEIGILPMPKYSESTPKYYTNVDAGQNVFSVPVTAADTARTSMVVEALCAEGYASIMPAFYDVSLKTKYSRDDESEAMLDYIKDGRVYDYGYFNSTLAGDLAYIGQRLVNTKNPNFTSFYEKNEGKVQKNIDALNR